ncbi:rhodanese-like domain-containing protein [Bacteroidota bacterium]
MRRKFIAVLVAVSAVILCSVLIASQNSNKISTSSTKTSKQVIKNIPVNDCNKLIQENINYSSFVLLDVRSEKEYNSEWINGAIQLDFYSKGFSKRINELDKTKTYLVYSESGKRAKYTLDLMRDLGFHKVFNMEGGINLWKNLGYTTQTK